MVELVINRLKRRLDVSEVHHPPRVHPWLTGQMHLDAEGVAMQARALVTSWHVGKAMRGFEGEDFEDIHPAILQTAQATRRTVLTEKISKLGAQIEHNRVSGESCGIVATFRESVSVPSHQLCGHP